MTKKKPAAKAESPASTLPDDGDKDRDDVNKSLEDLRAEREKWEKKFKSIEAWRKRLQAAQAAVARAQAEFEEADAERKRAKASVDTAIAKELELVSKFVHGEQMLPFDASEHQADEKSAGPIPQVAAGPANDHGASQAIESLLAKHLKKIVGKDVFDACKSRAEPIGLSDAQIETLVAADIKTIGDLEKRIREDAWFLKNLRGFGEKAVDRLTESLLAFRAVYPVPAAPEPVEPEPAAAPAAEVPAEPQPDDWEQSAYHLRELMAACHSLLESEIPEDGKQFCRSVAMDAEDMLRGIEEHKAVTVEQKTAIENWTTGVARWRN